MPDSVRPPVLSVTVLNYNYGHYLPLCLDSILRQTFEDFELILINDKSTDDSLEVIHPYLADPRVRLVDHLENMGFMRSLIEGSELSRGKYITVISADDWVLDATAFDKQVAVMDSDPEIAFAFTDYGCYASSTECTYVMHPAPASYVRPGRDAYRDIIVDRSPLHSGTLIRKAAYTQIGGYDPQMRWAVDTKMWAGLCHVGKVAYVGEVLYAYRIHNQNMSRGKAVVRESIDEVLRLIDWSFAMFPPQQQHELAWLRRKAIRRALSSYAIMFTFQFDNLARGWYYFWIAVRMRPLQALLQNTVLILGLRTVLGRRGYRAFERLKGCFSSKTRQRLEAERLHLGPGK